MIGFSLFMALVVLEISARVLHLGSGGFWEPNAQYGWQNIPGASGWESCYGDCSVFVEINDQGLRDREIPYEKPQDTRRVIFLGDSMTAGMQVEQADTFVKQLESGLQAADPNWETINAGVNAFGTDNELLFYQLEVHQYEADVVVLAMYLANDIYNNHRELEVRLSGTGHKPYFTLGGDGELVLHNFPVEKAETPATRFVSFLNRNFQLPRFFAELLNLRRDIPEALRPLVELAAGQRAAAPTPDPEAPPGQRRVTICDAEYAPQIQEAWDVTQAIILELEREVAANGAELVVLIIPASPQLSPPEGERDWYCEQPNLELGAFLQAESIPFLDMLYPFREHALAGGESLYFERDFHMNTAGHTLAGELLIDFFNTQFAGP